MFRQGKQFFFEKKNQKTFIHCTHPPRQKFFASFFQKRSAFFLLFLAAAGHSTDATIALTTQPGSELEATATQLVSGDLKQSRGEGDPPVMLVGSAKLSVRAAPAALFVQVQSASFCGSAGCSTSAYLKRGSGWVKILDSISGPIKVSRRSHRGMFDLLVHGKDRWVWNGTGVCGHVAGAGRGFAAFKEGVRGS